MSSKKFEIPPVEVPIPVYSIPSDEDYIEFLKDPESFGPTDGTSGFYSSLRFPNAEADIELDPDQ